MVKDSKKKSVVNMSLLSGLASGAVTHVSQADGLPLINRDPALIEINANILDEHGNAAARLTEAGKALVPQNGKAVVSDTPIYAIISNAVLPPAGKRGGKGGGAPTQYPWASMEVGGSFFVPVSAKHADPVKSMTSAVSSANMKYSEEVGEEKPHTRTKRGPGNKAVIGADGKPVRETVMRRDRKAVKKFELRAVKAGEKYGEWVAPADGVLVGRVI